MTTDLFSDKNSAKLICTKDFWFPDCLKAHDTGFPVGCQDPEPAIKGALIDKSAVNCQGKNVWNQCIACLFPLYNRPIPLR